MPLSNVVEDLPTILWHLDEPMADTSVLPQYYLSRFTRQHVTVALSGDGGDEVLAGYVTYLANRMRPWYRLVPGPLRRGVIAPVVRRLPPSYHKVGFDYMARRFVEGAELEPDAAHYWWRVLFTDDERRRILAPDARRLLGDHAPFADYLAAAPKRDEFAGNDRFLYLDLNTYLPNDILVKVDRTSMGQLAGGAGALSRPPPRRVPPERAPFAQAPRPDAEIPPAPRHAGDAPQAHHRPAQARLQCSGLSVVPGHARRDAPRYGLGTTATVVRRQGGAGDGRRAPHRPGRPWVQAVGARGAAPVA